MNKIEELKIELANLEINLKKLEDYRVDLIAEIVKIETESRTKSESISE